MLQPNFNEYPFLVLLSCGKIDHTSMVKITADAPFDNEAVSYLETKNLGFYAMN